MIAFPPAKINLGLYVERQRPDGYHDIQSIFSPIPLKDSLEVTSTQASQPELFTYGIPIPGNPANNLVIQAWNLLHTDYSIAPVAFHLVKNIPPGSGLGGGSSDGAFALMLLNDFFQLGLSTGQLQTYAGQLGTDCIFFVDLFIAYVQGKGDVIAPYSGTNVGGRKICLLTSDIHIDTADAYQNITPRELGQSLDVKLAASPESQWKTWLRNDFQNYAISKHPEIGSAITWLYSNGAVYASLTGSGSGIYGLFEEDADEVEHDTMDTWWGVTG